LRLGWMSSQRVVFILSDNYREQFGVPETSLAEALNRLRECGALIMGVREALASREAIEVLWTVPADQADSASPEALESKRPSG